MREDPAEALKVALPQEILTEIRNEFGDSSAWLEELGQWSGEVEVEVVDDFDNETSYTNVRLKSGGEESVLRFADESAVPVQCTQGVTIEGMRLRGEIAVRAVEAAATSSCTPVGAQKTLVILAKFPGYADTFTTAHAQNLVFADGTVKSLNTYWKENSAGLTSAAGTVVGWLTLDRVYTCDEYATMRLAAIKAADPLVDLTQFTRILIYFPNPGGCSFSGISTVGCTSVSSSDGYSLASLSMVVSNYATTIDQGVQITAHEAGHGLGLRHSASRDFGAEPLGALGVAGTLSTYGDKFSSMGYWNLGHYAAPQKLSLGWWVNNDEVRTITSNGTYTIAPSSLTATNPQGLKIQRGANSGAWIWLEYRQPVGLFDKALASQVFTGVLVHYEDSTNGGLTHLLDYSPGSTNWNGPALAAGLVWTDPYTNLTITVLSATASGATVNISYGSEPCSPQAPSLTVSPSTASVTAGQSVTYSVTLKNNDTAACSSSTFNLQPVVPAGWTGSISPTAATMAPGETASFGLTVTAPELAVTGTYAVGANAADSTRTATASASISVTQPVKTVTAPLALALKVDNTVATAKTKLTFTATATRNGVPQNKLPVVITIKNPNGTTTSYSIITGPTGAATLRTSLKSVGVYTAAATAKDGESVVESPAVSVTIK
jgi:M6 family metalloprotease-like protein